MFRLLIVDDEVIIANGIKTSIDWKGLGFVKVVTAYNLRQAKEAFAADSFDVMICDIEMPQGSGFELFEWVREEHPMTECIFLTCHMEFEYAKKAIQLGSLDYLLKPVLEDELKQTVMTALMKVKQERDNAAKLVERFWLEVLRRELPARSDLILEEARRLYLPYSKDTLFLPVWIQIAYWDKKLDARDEQIMLYAMRKSLEELVLNRFKDAYSIHLHEGVMVLVIPVHEDPDKQLFQEIEHHCKQYIEASNNYFYAHLSCLIGQSAPIDQLAQMTDLLAEYQRSQANKVDRVLFLHDQEQQAECDVPLPNMQVWGEMLRRLEQERLLADMCTYLESLKQVEHLDAKWLQRFYQSFLQFVLHTLQETGLRAEEILHEHLSLERAKTATRSIRDLEDWAMDVIVIAIARMKALESNETIVEKVRRYIELHLDEDLSRQYIADYVGLSPDYVVKLFKKEFGMSISDYILRERLAKAKELLLKSDMSISDVALSVGYPNFSYFSTLFRKETNMTPQEFRRQHALHRDH